mgnify:CR=1 FL=1
MDLSHEVRGNHLVVSLSGRMDVHLASEVENQLANLMKSQPDKHILLDLSDVEYMSSSGLRVFVSSMRTLRERNLNLLLCNLSPAVRKVFEVVELMDMFDIYESQEEALAAST